MGATIDEIRDQLLALLPRLHRFCVGLTGSVSDGEDLAQDTIERALRNLHSWEPGTRLDSWMFRIAKNRFIDRHRATKRENLVPMSDEVQDMNCGSVDGARIVESRLTLTKVNQALQTLPLEQREAVVLVLIDGMPYREAADALEIPIGTLTSRISRARAALVAAMGG
ncbi:MAG: RNA polymerase sigma factor [Alphaproteobacteria bacterium]|nr:RNA polymerase sigma factor [Alphaproteobacteria bacterium]